MTESGIAVVNIQRPSEQDLADLRAYGVSTVHEAMGRSGLLDCALRPIYPGARIAGSAITVFAHPGDNWMLHVGIEMIRPGDIMVVGLSSPCSDGFFGELMATSLVQRGCRGLIIDAGVRDVRELTELEFPVWSRWVSAKGTVKATLGSVNVPVICGGVLVNPGDAVIADDDGVVVVPRTRTTEVIAAARSRIDREDVKRKRLKSGELSLDIDGMRPRLQAAGLKYLNHPNDGD